MLPFDIRGRRNIAWGSNFKAGRGCRLEAYTSNNKPVLIIGDNVQIHDYVHITATQSVRIGNNVLMASKIYISDTSHGNYSGTGSDSDPAIFPGLRELQSKEVIIGDRVWLGEFVSVLPGVSIGEGTIVGANSVVSKSLPENVIAVGSPAKPVKKFNTKTKIWEPIT
jgi:lipopolysaccharide O-acetyltransferase